MKKRLIGFLREQWGNFLTLLGFLGVSYASMDFASTSKYLGQFDSIVFVFFGATSGLLFLIIVYLFKIIQRESLINAQVRNSIERDGINPLLDNFERQTISLPDFYHPYYRLNKNKRFETCRFFGPAFISYRGLTAIGCAFYQCQVVVVPEGELLIGVTAFEDPHFSNCDFYHVTFFMTEQEHARLPQEMREGLRRVSA